MNPTFATKSSYSKRKSVRARRWIALLGVFAILLQAVLVGWHHHPLPLSLHGARGVVAAVGMPAGHSTPTQADNDCQICFALSHYSAASGDFYLAPLPQFLPVRLAAVHTVWAPLPSYNLFRSRAPPRV